jgi:hypothetical protein
LAVAHTVEEIERLWAATEGNEDLRRIFSETEQEKINDNVYYTERLLNGDLPDCPNYPVFGSWRDNRVDITNP